MAHDHHATRQLVDERLEPLQAGEVEVVGRFVEEQHVEAAEQDGGERRARRLTTRQDAHRGVEQPNRQPDVVAHGAGARVEVGAAGREVRVERVGVRVGRRVRRVGQRGRGPFELGFGGGDAGATPEELEHRLVAALGFLDEVSDAQRRGRRGDRAPVRAFLTGEDAQQRALAHTVRTDDTEARAGSDRHVDAVEHGVRTVLAREVSGDERERRGLRGGRHADPRGRGGGRRAGGIRRSHAGHGTPARPRDPAKFATLVRGHESRRSQSLVSAARQQYQAANERYGRSGSPSASSSLAVGMSGRPWITA